MSPISWCSSLPRGHAGKQRWLRDSQRAKLASTGGKMYIQSQNKISAEKALILFFSFVISNGLKNPHLISESRPVRKLSGVFFQIAVFLGLSLLDCPRAWTCQLEIASSEPGVPPRNCGNRAFLGLTQNGCSCIVFITSTPVQGVHQ